MQKACNLVVYVTVSGDDSPANDFATESRIIVHDIFDEFAVEGRSITVRKVEALEGDFPEEEL